MSTTAADVFDRSAYQAPEANLVSGARQTENKLFSAEGRISNWHYNALFFKVMLVAAVAGGAMFGAMMTESQAVMVIVGVPLFLIVMAAFVSLIFASIKRLHDLGYSGWYYLIGIIPIVGVLFNLYYAIRPGSEDDNNYGAPRIPSQLDKVLGIMGMVLMVSLNIFALIPMD